MLTFIDYPINFRSIYTLELDKAKGYLDVINEVDKLANNLLKNSKYSNRVGKKVQIKSTKETLNVYLTYENSQRFLGYICENNEKRNFDKSIWKIVNEYNTDIDYIEKYKLFLDIYINNCLSVLKDSEINRNLIDNKHNFIKIIHIRNLKEESDDWRQYKSEFVEIEFVNAIDMISYKLKMPAFELKEHIYWQLSIMQEDVVEFVRSDEETFNFHKKQQ